MHNFNKTIIQNKALQNTYKSKQTVKVNLNNINWRKKREKTSQFYGAIQYCWQRDELTIELFIFILVLNDLKNRL